MSTPSDLPGSPASKLLNDDGSVNVSEVRSRANGGNASGTTIDTEICANIRRELADRQHVKKTADAIGIGQTATRRHAKGECHHDEDDVDAPALSYIPGRSDGWVVDE